MATEGVAPKVVIRDQVGDHLLTPKNSVLVVIDYQPTQLPDVSSMDRDLLLKNVVSTAKVAEGPNAPRWVGLAVELQRGWARVETVQEVGQIGLTERLLKED